MHRAWWTLTVATVVLMAFNGVRVAFGVLLKPIAADTGWSRSEIAGAATLSIFTTGFGFIVVGMLFDRYSPRRVIPWFAVAYLLGHLVVFKSTELWHIYFGFGVVSAFAAGAGFGPFMAVISRWFNKYQGLIAGIMMSATQLGIIAYAPASAALEPAVGWRWTFLALGITGAAALTLAGIVTHRSPEDVGLRPVGAEDAPPPSPLAATPASPPAKAISLRAALRDGRLWGLSTIFFGANVSVGAVMYHLVAYGTDKGLSAVVASGAVSVISATSIAGRLSLGSLSDRVDSGKLVFVSLLMVTVMTGVAFVLPGALGLYGFAIVYGFFMGGWVVQLPLITRATFGPTSLGAILGVILFITSAGQSTGILIGGASFDLADSYTPAFLISSGFAGLAAAGTLRLLGRRPAAPAAGFASTGRS